MSNSTKQLDNCGCCAPGFEPLPAHYNRSGLPQLKFRIGTHSEFLHRMMHLIPYIVMPTGDNVGSRPLLGLTTRSTDDPSIALLDAWATSLDVLTFYQERIANEGYLRTATERRSVLELAREIGYELNPGVASSTHIAFTLDESTGSPAVVTIPVGMRMMNIPDGDALPQKFETVEEIEARPEWNRILPRMRETSALTQYSTSIDLKGTATDLQPGDTILIVGDERDTSPASKRWVHIIVTQVKVNLKAKYTTVYWEKAYLDEWKDMWNPTGTVTATDAIPTNPRVYALRLRTALFGYNAPDWKTLQQSIRANYGNGSDWQNMDVTADGEFDLTGEYPRILTGSWLVVSGDVQSSSTGVAVTSRNTRLYRATSVSSVPRVDFTLNATVTHIVPDTTPVIPSGGGGRKADPDVFKLRTVTVYAESEELELAESPAVTPVEGRQIVLDGIVLGLMPGRKVVVSGKRPRFTFTSSQLLNVGVPQKITVGPRDVLQLLSPIVAADKSKGGAIATGATKAKDLELRLPVKMRGGVSGVVSGGSDITQSILWQAVELKDAITSEVAIIDSITNDNVHTTITFHDPLEQVYDRASTVILANVAEATHGQSIDEVLGSGNGAQANQRFNLKKPPLTYTPAVNASGSESTLALRVNDVLWKEVGYLYGRQPREEVYIVRIGNDGATTVIFGDGHNGARLPSGADNITVHYRSGIGSPGEVPANSITVPQTRPLGVSSINNPVPATGSAQPEQIEDARKNAPNTVLTFERVVSLRDFEDFSRGFAGIAKARAAILWNGSQEFVLITVAGNNGQPATEALRRNLAGSIDALRDPSISFIVKGFEPKQFDVRAKVVIDPRYIEANVLAAVVAMLNTTYSFPNRTFAQNVSASEVIAAIQRVEGVVAVDLDHLAFTPETGTSGVLELNDVLVSRDARWGIDGLDAAQLLLINPSGITITSNQERP